MFSQNQEEKIIRQYFESPGGNLKPGTVLDIGANDGETLSNSRALILGGWDGVLVEPDPVAYKKLSDLYKWDKSTGIHPSVLQMAIGDGVGKLPFYSVGDHLGKGDSGLLSTLNLAELQSRFPGTPYNVTEVEVYNWEKFYEIVTDRYRLINKPYFDFITIDAEGFDLTILRQINFHETKTKLVCVEWNGKDRHLYDQVMYKQDFRIIHLNGENIIYGR